MAAPAAVRRFASISLRDACGEGGNATLEPLCPARVLLLPPPPCLTWGTSLDIPGPQGPLGDGRTIGLAFVHKSPSAPRWGRARGTMIVQCPRGTQRRAWHQFSTQQMTLLGWIQQTSYLWFLPVLHFSLVPLKVFQQSMGSSRNMLG